MFLRQPCTNRLVLPMEASNDTLTDIVLERLARGRFPGQFPEQELYYRWWARSHNKQALHILQDSLEAAHPEWNNTVCKAYILNP